MSARVESSGQTHHSGRIQQKRMVSTTLTGALFISRYHSYVRGNLMEFSHLQSFAGTFLADM